MLAVESHTRMLKSDSVELNVTLRGFPLLFPPHFARIILEEDKDRTLKNFSPGNELYVDFFSFLQQTSKNMLSSILLNRTQKYIP